MDTEAIFAELRAWLSANWDPDLTVAAWWELLGLSGWAAPSLPPTAYGRGLLRTDAVRVQRELGAFGALGPPQGLGLLLAAPTIATHGTPEQVERHVREIVTGQAAWCQLFSEPSAGSDLAGLRTRAVRDGEVWVVNGQKVWTSLGRNADFGMLIARTDPDAPKHRGISWFALDMHQPGVDVRPLREMTGHSLFNEVFLTDATVADNALIGGLNQGWAVTNTTLANERAGLGSGGGAATGAVEPGTVAGNLNRRAGDFVATARRSTSNNEGPDVFSGTARRLVDLARAKGKDKEPGIRQDLVRLYALGELGRLNALRVKAAKQTGSDIPGMPNIAKLTMSDTVRLSRDLGLRILGAAGTLHPYEEKEREVLERVTGDPLLPAYTGMALFAQAPPIYGGTDQIQRNILAERVLGLPKGPGDDRNTPFSKLPANG
jgi:alkylation response protein AidB-like acyl-CoA dehydrogenase